LKSFGFVRFWKKWISKWVKQHTNRKKDREKNGSTPLCDTRLSIQRGRVRILAAKVQKKRELARILKKVKGKRSNLPLFFTSNIIFEKMGNRNFPISNPLISNLMSSGFRIRTTELNQTWRSMIIFWITFSGGFQCFPVWPKFLKLFLWVPFSFILFVWRASSTCGFFQKDFHKQFR
jgi:hypothetical protein